MNVKQFFLILFIMLTSFLMSFDENLEGGDNEGKFVVVLDAGHGGHDPGNLGNGYFEKNIALRIVLGVGKILEADPNVRVVYTRKDDTFVDLYKRGEIANKANADLFVSVHCDSHTSNAQGAGTFVLGLHATKQNFEIAKKENSVIYLEDDYESRYAAYDINSPESIIGLTIMQEEFLDQSINLATLMQDNFSKKLKRTDRKVKQAGFIVLHQTFMPSVLVETGFLTNKDEGAYLNSKKGQEEMAGAIADAIRAYRKNMVAHAEPAVSKNKLVIVDANTGTQVQPQSGDSAIEKKSKPKIVVKDASTTTTPAVTEKREEEVVTVKDLPAETAKPEKTLPNIIFKVQIFASGKDIPLHPGNFKGLNTLSKESYNSLYRY
ncbi:MAG TPA: N-acetylmuramoyl-L-alanine amidase, partial [Arenibacter sp.]|nr:N-acetylmuramoyl-L-alanine amidase [Arenibacter sp.]